MLSTNAEMPRSTETGGKLARLGAFQHLLKQALALKEEEVLGLQSLLELLAQVPAIRGVEPVLPRAWDASGIDALVRLQLEDRLQPIACAVLANGQPRHVRLALWELTHAIRRDCPDAIPLLIAPFLSPPARPLQGTQGRLS